MATGVIRSALGVIVLALAFAACGSPTHSLRAMTTPDCSGAKHEFDAPVTFRVQG
jgi:hypothetical protein